MEDWRVCLDPGHGGKDPGAVYGGLKEKDITLPIARYAMEGIQAIDARTWVCLTRSFDQTVSLEQRATFANNMHVDCFVAIHCNADPDLDAVGMPEARGEEIWIYQGSIKGFRLAQAMQDEVDRIFPVEPFRGIRMTKNLYVLKHTRAPACLVECGFIDKSSSIETFSDILTLMKIGTLVGRGVVNYLMQKGG